MVKLNGKLALTLCTAVILATMTIFASTNTAFAGCRGDYIRTSNQVLDYRCQKYSPGCHASPEPRWEQEEERQITEYWYDDGELCDTVQWTEWQGSGNCCQK